jgi:hypothetical protein
VVGVKPIWIDRWPAQRHEVRLRLLLGREVRAVLVGMGEGWGRRKAGEDNECCNQ